ncbi:mechanosensitive ion channel family protein [Corynebacteriaceae bacterium 6-324]|uniref:mechanosensitive ion channel family protein n=1 Tax=Corynebacterium sp. TaxID=1720 RepID=UPI0028AA031D|nr:mechanosensitive ion channel family protein [Corynebacterium sp.]
MITLTNFSSLADKTTLAAASTTPSEAVDNVSSWWSDPQTQEWLINRPIAIGLIIIVALILHWLVRRLIGKLAQSSIEKKTIRTSAIAKLARPGGINKKQKEKQEKQLEAIDKSHENRRISRIKTLANVARSAAAIVVWGWAFLASLDQVGVNIAPLIASAGVLGVALGFGAQSLVKDFLSGIFMLLEDQYGIGDTIDLGNGIFGDVEEITLRITTVRDIDGALWYVRNGEILQVANHSDEFSVARVQVPVGLSNNTEKAYEVIESSVKAAAKTPEVAGLILDEPVVNGVTDFQPDYLSFRVSVKTLPGSQWDVQRILQARVLNSMNDAGIVTPYPYGIGITAPQLKKDE